MSTRYISFYATCEHELLPVTKGHRLALVYNLCRDDGLPKPSVPSFLDAGQDAEEAGDAVDVLDVLQRDARALPPPPQPHAVLHELGPADGRDASLAEALRTSDAFDLFLVNVKRTESGDDEWATIDDVEVDASSWAAAESMPAAAAKPRG